MAKKVQRQNVKSDRLTSFGLNKLQSSFYNFIFNADSLITLHFKRRSTLPLLIHCNSRRLARVALSYVDEPPKGTVATHASRTPVVASACTTMQCYVHAVTPHVTSAMSNRFTFLSQPLQPHLAVAQQLTLYDHTLPVRVCDTVTMACRKCERCDANRNWFV